jgi:hypothetical protein
MKFTQTIEFSTARIDEFHARLDKWKVETEGRRSPTERCSGGIGTPRMCTC